jgi:hypothetical protein
VCVCVCIEIVLEIQRAHVSRDTKCTRAQTERDRKKAGVWVVGGGSVIFVFSDTQQFNHKLTWRGAGMGLRLEGKWLSVAGELVVAGWGGRGAEGSIIVA